MRGFGFFLGFTGGGGAAGWIGYLLNALGFNTGSTAQTLTAPDPVLALDWEGTLTDFGGAVNASGDSVAPPPGSRLATTVADGAVLGSELFLSPSVPTGWADLGDGVYSWSGTSTDYRLEISGLAANTKLTGSFEIFDYIGTGEVGISASTFVDATSYRDDANAVIPYESETIGAVFNFFGRDTCTFKLRLITTKQVLPTVLDTDTFSNPLHPSVTTGGVTDYVFYPTHEVSTAYSSDKFVWAEASDGSTRYYSSSGGTSAGSAPTFPTSGTVVDNDITWTYEGRYGLSGQRVEGAATNLLTYSETFDKVLSGSVWLETGGASVASDSVVAPDGETTGDTLTGLAAGNDSKLQQTGVDPAGNTYTFSVWMKGAGTLSLGLSNSVDDVTREVITLTSEWFRYHTTKTFNATSGDLRCEFISQAGATATSVDVWGAQITVGSFASSYIPTTTSTVTRSAVNMKTVVSDTNLVTDDGAARMVITPLGTGQVGKILASYTDASNELSVDFTATTITLNKKVSGSTITATKTYTHADGEQIIIDFSYGSGGMSINIFVVGATAGSAGTNAATSAAVLGTNIQFGASNDLSHINATFDTAIRSYATEAQASADIADWSL